MCVGPLMEATMAFGERVQGRVWMKVGRLRLVGGAGKSEMGDHELEMEVKESFEASSAGVGGRPHHLRCR